jgi:hypothetical protein
VITVLQWCKSRSSRLTAVVCSGAEAACPAMALWTRGRAGDTDAEGRFARALPCVDIGLLAQPRKVSVFAIWAAAWPAPARSRRISVGESIVHGLG